MVPFNGAALAVNSTIGGHTPIAFTALPPAMSNIKDGKLWGIAVLSTKRSPSLPDVPTNIEAGVPDLEGDTPEEFGERLKAEMAKWGRVVRDANIRAG